MGRSPATCIVFIRATPEQRRLIRLAAAREDLSTQKWALAQLLAAAADKPLLDGGDRGVEERVRVPLL